MRLTILFLLAVSFFTACKKDSKPTYSNTRSSLSSFPLTVGNDWKYHTVSTTVLTNDTSGPVTTVQNFLSRWTVLSDTVISGQSASKIAQVDSGVDVNYLNATASYYGNAADGFYGLGVLQSGSMFFLRTDEDVTASTGDGFGFSFRMDEADTIFVPAAPIRFLKFPIVENSPWLSNEYGSQFMFKRRWLSDTTLTTTAGTFDCTKLQAYFDFDNDSQPDSGDVRIFQYFSTKGLIKEVRMQPNMTTGSGNGWHKQITELTNVNF